MNEKLNRLKAEMETLLIQALVEVNSSRFFMAEQKIKEVTKLQEKIINCIVGEE